MPADDDRSTPFPGERRGAGSAAPARPPPPSGLRRPGVPGPAQAGRVLLVLALGVATLKLVVVQTVQAGDLAAASERQAITNVALPAVRGEITDRAGNPLAFSAEARALVTNPRLIAATHGAGALQYQLDMAAGVAQATGEDQATLLGLLTSDKGYVVLDKLVDPDVARSIRSGSRRSPRSAARTASTRPGTWPPTSSAPPPGTPTSASWSAGSGWRARRTTRWPAPRACAWWTPPRTATR